MRLAADVILNAARIATGHLGWTPDRFWDATAAELLVVLEGLVGGEAHLPLGSAELKQLMEKMGHG